MAAGVRASRRVRQVIRTLREIEDTLEHEPETTVLPGVFGMHESTVNLDDSLIPATLSRCTCATASRVSDCTYYPGFW